MTIVWKLAGACALGLALCAMLTPATADDTKTPTVKEIMTKLNKPKGLQLELEKDLKAPEPDWEHIQEHSKEMLELVKSLAKNEPRKGDKESWMKHTKIYEENVTAINEAAKNKDKDKVVAGLKKIRQSCSACHGSHK